MSATEPIVIEFWGDLSCPFAFLAHHRLRRVLPRYGGRIALAHKCLALEYVNRRVTPKRALDLETPFLAVTEPDLPFQPWSAPDSEWPVTLWPAFEAVACAERQSLALADELAWSIRVAFFRDSRCVSMRHVLLELAEAAGLDMTSFERDFDAGVEKSRVIGEAREGWDRAKLPGSPTLVLPNGERVDGGQLGLPDLELDDAQGLRPVRWQEGACAGDACLDLLHGLLDRALRR